MVSNVQVIKVSKYTLLDNPIVHLITKNNDKHVTAVLIRTNTCTCVPNKTHIHTHTNYTHTALYQRSACTYQNLVTVTNKCLSIKHLRSFFLKSITNDDFLMYVGNEFHTSDPCISILNLRT